MPYDLTGFDSAGVQHAFVMDDMGVVTGGEQLTAWLSENPYVKSAPAAGETVPASGALTPSQVEAMRQHVSKILTYVQMAPQPVLEAEPKDAPAAGRREAAPPSAPPPAHRHTTVELEAMTVTDLRSLAVSAQIAGASTMNKAELVTALQAHERSRPER
jgi:hypothetical protein